MQQVQISKDRFRYAVVVFPVVQNDFFSCVLRRASCLLQYKQEKFI